MAKSSIAIYCLNKKLKSHGEFLKSDLRTNQQTCLQMILYFLNYYHLNICQETKLYLWQVHYQAWVTKNTHSSRNPSCSLASLISIWCATVWKKPPSKKDCNIIFTNSLQWELLSSKYLSYTPLVVFGNPQGPAIWQLDSKGRWAEWTQGGHAMRNTGGGCGSMDISDSLLRGCLDDEVPILCSHRQLS